MFSALGRLTSRHPWWIIAAWIVIAVVVVASAPALKSTSDQSDFLPRHYESIKASELMDEAFPQQQTSGATIVFDHADGSPLTDADAAAITDLVGRLTLAPDFSKAEEVQLSPTGQVAIVNLDYADGVDSSTDDSIYDQVPELRDELASLTEGTGLRAQTTGDIPSGYDQMQSGSNAEAIVGVATLVLIVVLLAVIFRSVLISIMPIFLVGLVSSVANGLIAWASKLFGLETDSSISVILIVVLFGIGTDYILFFLFRYRERLREIEIPTEKKARREAQKGAVAHAVERAGEAIASAGGAVFVAFMTLLLSTLGIFRSIGPALGIAVAVTLIAALTLVPAVTTVLGKGLFWPSKKWKVAGKGAGFGWMGKQLGRRPGRTAVVSGGVLVILSLFCFLFGGFKPSFDLTSSSSAADVESAQATATMEAGGFSAGATQPTPIVVASTDGQALDADGLAAFVQAVQAVPGVAAVARTRSSPPTGPPPW